MSLTYARSFEILRNPRCELHKAEINQGGLCIQAPTTKSLRVPWLATKGIDKLVGTHHPPRARRASPFPTTAHPEHRGLLHFPPGASHIPGGDTTAEQLLINGLSLNNYFCKGRLILKSKTVCEIKRNRWSILELDWEGGKWGIQIHSSLLFHWI